MLSQMGNVESAMFGFGEVFYEGERMPASTLIKQVSSRAASTPTMPQTTWACSGGSTAPTPTDR